MLRRFLPWSLILACAPDDPAVTGAPFTTTATGADGGAQTSGDDDDDDDTAADTRADESTDPVSDDGPPETSGDTTGGAACPEIVDPDAPWIAELQYDVVARLSGELALPSGETLPERSTAEHRVAAVDYLEAVWIEHGLMPTLHTYSPTGTNLYAALPATVATDETIVIGAHYDTVPQSPGANDNATGVAMVTSLGRWLAEAPCRSRNVILVLFDEEEIGLLGSDAFAGMLAGQDIDVMSVHTIDQMGWDADGDRTLELERADAGLFDLYEAAEPLVPGETPLVPTDTGFTDHVSFRAWGFAAVGLTEEYVSGDTTPHYHLPSDGFDTVDLDFLASSTRLLHGTIGGLVGAPPG